MTRLSFILAIIILTIGCAESKESKSTLSQSTSKIDSATDLLNEAQEDTILERNNPNSLDLAKHQIFIDTTRNSTFYERVKNWSESQWDKQAIDSYLNSINQDFKSEKVVINDFPSHFITLRKLNNQFVLYDRCDGIDPRFEIRDTAFIFYGPLESEAELISKMVSLTDNSIELELRTIQENSSDQLSRLQIEKIDDFIYKLTYKNQTFDRVDYVTTVEGIEKFDLIVNNCPTMKMMEFDGFDEEK